MEYFAGSSSGRWDQNLIGLTIESGLQKGWIQLVLQNPSERTLLLKRVGQQLFECISFPTWGTEEITLISSKQWKILDIISSEILIISWLYFEALLLIQKYEVFSDKNGKNGSQNGQIYDATSTDTFWNKVETSSIIFLKLTRQNSNIFHQCSFLKKTPKFSKFWRERGRVKHANSYTYWKSISIL